MLLKKGDLEGNADEKRQKVCARLRHLYAAKTKKCRQQENERQVADALAAGSEYRRRNFIAQGLIELVDKQIGRASCRERVSLDV